ncbi:hypothetical protein EV426DRAFT_597320, partial [Tirmania nivea]
TKLSLVLTNKVLYAHVLPHLYRHLTISWASPKSHLPMPYRLTLLIRALILRPETQGYVRKLEIMGWGDKLRSFKHNIRLKAVFTFKEMQTLKSLLAEVVGENGMQRVMDHVVSWEPEAVVGVVLFLLRRSGFLRELRIIFPEPVSYGASPERRVPLRDIFWQFLNRIIPEGSGEHPYPFSQLSSLLIKVNCSYSHEYSSYCPSLTPLTLPLLRLPSLTNLALSVPTIEPLTFTLPPPITITNITNLTLRTPPHLTTTLHTLLPLIPRLCYLGLTFLLDLSAYNCRFSVVRYDSLGNALQLVKNTLTRLRICFLEFSPSSSYNKAFLGYAKLLRLQEIVKLEKLTIGLSVLLGTGGGGRISLVDMLPRSLSELWIGQDCANAWGWEWEEEVVRVLIELIQSKGVHTGGCLGKIGILRDLHMLDSLKMMNLWPKEVERVELERVGMEAGVEMMWDVGREFWREEQEEAMGKMRRAGVV